ncbi:hypothetical protein [Prevotella veroralis]|uniref:Uncharacterized protein n=2 Tax=Prevotella veroralis TaxID=28137 RepID=C9MKR5_9BACT|nr:hypothetical protein [Prevotella veroralis]EEX19870.1 hypothetical protein HMPREF0973_00189 [Prevotella veroralis F0319]
MIKRHVAFSQLVTMLRLTLMYYTDFISFMENPQNEGLIIMVEKANAPPKELNLFDQGDMNFKKECEITYIKVILQGFVKDFDSFTIRKD